MGDKNRGLTKNRLDWLVEVLKGLTGIKFGPIGSLVVGLCSTAIPGQRQDRIVDAIEKIDKRVSDLALTCDQIEKYFCKPGFYELLENACEQASREYIETRRDQIAQIVIKGLLGDEIVKQRCQYFLGVLRQLTDTEIIVLISFWDVGSDRNTKYLTKHADVVDPANNPDSEAFFVNYTKHLESLGFLYRDYGTKWEILDDGPPSQPSCREKEGYTITDSGVIFLEYIGITEYI